MSVTISLQEVKMEFAQMYGELCRYNFISHDIFTMGNLAFFMDRTYQRIKGRELQKTMRQHLKKEEKQTFLLTVAIQVHQYAKREERGENLDFRLKRIQELHERGKLNHFDILLDEYDFPEWFKSYIPFIECSDHQELSEKLLPLAEGDEDLKCGMIERNEWTKLKIVASRIFAHAKKWEYLLPLVDALLEKDEKKITTLLDSFK